jgi:hypothetical protein
MFQKIICQEIEITNFKLNFGKGGYFEGLEKKKNKYSKAVTKFNSGDTIN